MAEKTTTPIPTRRVGYPAGFLTIPLLILPLIVLGGVIALFLTTGGGLDLEAPVPIENLAIERTILERGQITLIVRNTGPQPLTVAQININEATYPFSVDPDATIPRLRQARITIPYDWTEGEAYAVTLFTANAIAFDVDIPVAFTTPTPSGQLFWSFALIGLYVGVIPVYLGILWYPALRQLSRRWMVFLLAVTIGLLIFLGIDTLSEALEQAAVVPGAFQGIGLAGIGLVATFVLLEALSRLQGTTGRSEAAQRLTLAYLIALGIGVHNLGEGLAIGAAYSVGEIALGAFLVVGFIIQNITEGLGIIAPVVRDRPALWQLAVMGLVGGAPAILGAWLGGFSPSPVLAVLFLGIGAGAIFQVVYAIGRMLQHDTADQPRPVEIFAGVVAGMLLLWVTGVFIK